MSENKVAVITGGGTGIGAATAEELAQTGVKVVVVGRRPDPLAAVAKKINDYGGVAIAHPADVTDFAAMEDLVKETINKFGKVDLLVANAAVHDVSSIDSGDPEWWQTLININVVGLLFTVRAFLPKMYHQESGHILVVSSLSGRVTYVGEPAYVASKHAQVAFTDCLRKEATPKGIKVSIIEPGIVDTPMISNPFADDLKKTVLPLDPFDVARAIRFVFEQPPNCTIYEISMRPLKQLL